MGGCVQVCIAASNEPCIHKSASDVACRDSARPVALLRSSCENDTQSWDFNASQCTWLQMGSAVLWKTPKNFDCELLHWAWEGVYRPVLQRVMSLHPQIRMRWICGETAVSPVALLRSSCGNNTQSWDSMQVSAPGCRCDEQHVDSNRIDCARKT